MSEEILLLWLEDSVSVLKHSPLKIDARMKFSGICRRIFTISESSGKANEPMRTDFDLSQFHYYASSELLRVGGIIK